MKTYKLVKHTYLNPYFIENGPEVERIHFFSDGEVIASTNMGWLCMYGSGNAGNTTIEAISFRRKMKPQLNADYSYFVGDELYIFTEELPGFLFAPDVVELETDEATYYANRVYFECAANDVDHVHLKTHELRSFMVGSYSKVVKKDLGQQIESTVDAFKDIGVRISSTDARKIIKSAQIITNTINS